MNISKGLVGLLITGMLVVGCDDSSTGTQQEEQSSNSESYSVPEDFDYSAYWENNEEVKDVCARLDSLCLEKHWNEEGEDANLSYEPTGETSSEEVSSDQVSSETDPSSDGEQPSSSLSSDQKVSSSADTTSVSSSSDTTEYSSDAAISSSSSVNTEPVVCLVDTSDTLVFAQTVDTVHFSLESGGYETNQTLELTTSTSGAVIYYTTDGCQPNQNSKVYTGPITIDRGMKIRARAFKPAWNASPYAKGYYAVQTGRDCFYYGESGPLVCNEKIYNVWKAGNMIAMSRLAYYDSLAMDTTEARFCTNTSTYMPKCSYGSVVYSWEKAMEGADSTAANPSGVQGVCPNGWHVPSEAEFTIFVATLANEKGLLAMSNGKWTEIGPYIGTGYGGYYDDNHGWTANREQGRNWTTTKNDLGRISYLYHQKEDSYINVPNAVGFSTNGGEDMLALRCFKD